MTNYSLTISYVNYELMLIGTRKGKNERELGKVHMYVHARTHVIFPTSTRRATKNAVGKTTTTKTKKRFCMLHRHKPTHSTKQCHTLKKGAEKRKVEKMATAKIPSARTIQARKRFTRSQHFPKRNGKRIRKC